MGRSVHRFGCAMLCLIALSLMGALTQCPWYHLVVEVPDFDSNAIEGIQLWRSEDPDSPSVVEAGRIVFNDCTVENGSEVLTYTMLDSQDEILEFWSPVRVERADGESDAVTLRFIFAAWTEQPGWIRVSTFNAVGESDLSDEMTYF